MQNFSNLLDAIEREGISVSVVGGKLKVEPASKITDEIRASIKENRQGIIAALLMGGNNLPGIDQALDSDGLKLGSQSQDQINSELPKNGDLKSDGQKKESPKLGAARNCSLCGRPLNLDGGDCWHKAFHVGDQSVKLRTPDPAPKVGTATSSPESKKAAAGPRLNDQAPGILPHVREQINPVALSWLLKNQQELKRHGWAASQLWRRNKSRGILFSPIWEKPFLKTTLLESGAVEFEFIDAGRDCINLARPMPHGKLKSKRRIAS
jgi:hypothetical protein